MPHSRDELHLVPEPTHLPIVVALDALQQLEALLDDLDDPGRANQMNIASGELVNDIITTGVLHSHATTYAENIRRAYPNHERVSTFLEILWPALNEIDALCRELVPDLGCSPGVRGPYADPAP